MTFRSLLIVAGLLGPLSAHATLYGGNPTLSFHVSRPANDFTGGFVELHQLRLNKCNGQTITWTLDDEIDPVDGWSMGIPAGDHCSVTFFWDTAMEIDGSAFVIEYDAASTNVQLSSQIAPVVLSPVDVVSGSFSGLSPRLYLDIH